VAGDGPAHPVARPDRARARGAPRGGGRAGDPGPGPGPPRRRGRGGPAAGRLRQCRPGLSRRCRREGREVGRHPRPPGDAREVGDPARRRGHGPHGRGDRPGRAAPRRRRDRAVARCRAARPGRTRSDAGLRRHASRRGPEPARRPRRHGERRSAHRDRRSPAAAAARARVPAVRAAPGRGARGAGPGPGAPPGGLRVPDTAAGRAPARPGPLRTPGARALPAGQARTGPRRDEGRRGAALPRGAAPTCSGGSRSRRWPPRRSGPPAGWGWAPGCPCPST
jgi:hypothetical protein